MLRPLAGWSAGVIAYFLLIGLIAASLTEFLADNPRFADLAGQAGFPGLGAVEGYTATLFALLAIAVGVFAAVRIATAAAAETGRRLTMLFAGPVTLAGAEIAATAGGAVVLVIVAGLATWTGTAMVGAGLGIGAALAGIFNVLPVAALCLGAAVFALGVFPSAVAWVGALPAVGGFLLKVIADSAGAPGWVGELSPFAHLALVPAEGCSAPPGSSTAIAETCVVERRRIRADGRGSVQVSGAVSKCVSGRGRGDPAARRRP